MHFFPFNYHFNHILSRGKPDPTNDTEINMTRNI